MRWLRIAIYCSPLVLIALAAYFLRSLTASKEAAAESITFAITTEPIGVDPLTEQDPISEEIESLLFDKLLGRTAEMELEGRLAESWSYAAEARYFFDFERYAKTAWAAFEEKTKGRWKGWGIEAAELVGDEIRVRLNHRRSSVCYEILRELPAADLAEVSLWYIRTEHSAAPLFETFRQGAVEGGQVRRTWSESPDFIEVHSAGKHENFQRELELFYSESNQQLGGKVELVRQEPFLFEPSMTMNLRDAQWHDGRPVTTADVLHSIEVARESESQPMLSCALRSIAGIDAAGPRSFRIRYRREFAPTLEIWEQMPILPAHAWHNFSPTRPELPRLIGTGPFMIRDWKPGGPIVLDRNENYFRGRPDNPRFVYERVLDSRLRRVLFETHSIDSYEAKPTTYGYLRGHDDFNLVRSPPTDHVFVAWNLEREGLSDPRVRQALAHGIDLDKLMADLLGGQGRRVEQLVHPGAGFGQEPIREFAYDRDLAWQLLEDAGWRNKLRFTLSVAGPDEFQQVLGRRLREEWGRIGVDVQLRFASYGEMSGIHTSKTPFDAALLTERLGHGVDLFGLWHSSEIGPGRGNYTRLRDDEVDRLLEEVRLSFDETKARELSMQVRTRVHDLQPQTQLFLAESARVFNRDAAFVVDRSARGEPVRREIGDDGVSLTHDLAWWVKAASATPEPKPATPAAIDVIPLLR